MKQIKEVKEKLKVPHLNAPLSELTKGYDNVPIKDMNAWVNRPVEVRKKECDVRHGYITRPMNSFMMYRSAYAERTKIWCLQNNHQVVSSVSGESWPMEPPEIRELYIELAKIERDHHAKAHPEYKFSPAKNDASGRKRKSENDIEDDGESVDLEDPDYNWQPRRDRNGKENVRKTKQLLQETTYPVNIDQQSRYAVNTMNMPTRRERSTFGYNNPGKPLPAPLGAHDLYRQYYQTAINSNIQGPNLVEDLIVRKTEAPSMQHVSRLPLIGLPGAHHYELLDEQSAGDRNALINNLDIGSNLDVHLDPQLDPLLSECDPSFMAASNLSSNESSFQDFTQNKQSRSMAPQPSSILSDEYRKHEDGNPIEYETRYQDRAQNDCSAEYLPKCEDDTLYPSVISPWELDSQQFNGEQVTEIERWMKLNSKR